MTNRRIKNIPAQSLIVYPNVQRKPPTRKRVNDLKEKFDLDKVGIVTVSHRADGTYSLLDGQTRVAVLNEMGLQDHQLACDVYENLLESEEANIFRLLNDTRKPTPLDDFKVGVTAGDPECIAITEIVESWGVRITGSTHDGEIACVSALRKCYIGGELDRALETAVNAWGVSAASVEGNLLLGLCVVFEAYGDEVDQPSLIRKLSKFTGGAGGIIATARSARAIRSASIARLCAAAIIAVYNKGRRVNALPDL